MSTRLSEILEAHRTGPGIQRAKEVVAVRVGLVDSAEARAMQEKVRTMRPAVLAAQLKNMLDVDLLSLLARAWGQVRKVHDAVEESVKAPSAEQSVELPGHTFEATLTPRLVLSVEGVDWGNIDFELALTAKLTSATLHIAAGRLTAVELGHVTGSIRFSCEGTELQEYARELNLLPEYRLDPPITIPGERGNDAGSEL